MTDAASVVVDVLREHVLAGGHVDHMTGVVSVKCKACQEWIPDSGEYRGGFKAHVAAAVVDALKLTRRQGIEDVMQPNATEFWHCWATPWERTCTCTPDADDENCPIHEGR